MWEMRWYVPTASSLSTPYKKHSNSGFGQQQQPVEEEWGIPQGLLSREIILKNYLLKNIKHQKVY
jgi:hypothetical protein